MCSKVYEYLLSLLLLISILACTSISRAETLIELKKGKLKIGNSIHSVSYVCNISSGSLRVLILKNGKKRVVSRSSILRLTKKERRKVDSQANACRTRSERNNRNINNPSPTLTPSPVSPDISPTPTQAPALVPNNVEEVVLPYSSDTLSSERVVSLSGICTFCNSNSDVNFNVRTSTLVDVAFVSISLLTDSEERETTAPFPINQSIQIRAKKYVSGRETVIIDAKINNSVIGSFSIPVRVLGDEDTATSHSLFVSSSKLNSIQDGSPNSPINDIYEAFERVKSIFNSNQSANVEMLLDSGNFYLGGRKITFNMDKISSTGSFIIRPWNNSKPRIFLGSRIPSSGWSMIGDNKWQFCGLSSVLGIDVTSLSSNTASISSKIEGVVPLVNQKEMTLARFPNEGVLSVNSTTPVSVSGENYLDISPSLPLPTGIENGLTVRSVISYDNLFSTARNQAQTVAGKLRIKSDFGVSFGLIKNGNSFYLEGHVGLLDIDGEYVFSGNCLTFKSSNFNPQVDTVEISSSSNNSGLKIQSNLPTSNNLGSILFERISIAGGAGVVPYGSSNSAFCGDYSEQGSIINLSGTAANVSFQGMSFGPSQLMGISAQHYVNNINIERSVFSGLSGSSIWLTGKVLRETPSVADVAIRNNAFLKTNSSCQNSNHITLDSVGNISIEKNYIADSSRYGIALRGSRYYYTTKNWLSECTNPSSDKTGLNCSNPQLSWLDSQEFNPTYGHKIESNYIKDTRNPSIFADGGLVMFWGTKYQQLHPSVEFNNNFVVNTKNAKSKDHLVGVYNDDGGNSVSISNSVIVTTGSGSFMPVFLKGFGSSLEGSIIYSSKESSWSMVHLRELLASENLSDPVLSYLEFNAELNRNTSITNNGFYQLPGSPTESLFGGEIFTSELWNNMTGYGRPIEVSNFNIFGMQSSVTSSNLFRMPRSLPSFSFLNWQNGTGGGLSGQNMDSSSSYISADIPTKSELLSGIVIPKDSISQDAFSHLQDLEVGTNQICENYVWACQDSTLIKFR